MMSVIIMIIYMKMHLRALSLLLVVVQMRAQVFPSRYSFLSESTVSVNGSSFTHRCTSIIHGGPGVISSCDEPSTSVLFDGDIPTLTGLDGDMWASQLLTLRSYGSQVQLSFHFTDDYVGTGRVELDIFNCPEWGVAVQGIGITGAQSTTSCSALLGIVTPTTTSCDSLVRVCIPALNTTLPVLALQFFLHADANWVHLAEVTFSNASTSSSCPPLPEVNHLTTTSEPFNQTTVEPQTAGPDSSCPTQSEGCPDCPTQTQSPSCSTQSEDEVCPSSSTTTILVSVITATATALLATVIFVLVQIAVCKYHPKFTPGGAETRTGREEEEEYVQMDGDGGGDPTYMEVGAGGGGCTFHLKENEAYGEYPKNDK